MIKTAGGVPSPTATPHDEDVHGRFRLHTVGDTAQPAVEPSQAQGKEVWRQVLIQGRVQAEIDIPSVGKRPIAMRPGSENESYRPVLAGHQAHIIFRGGAGIGVVPRGHMHLRDIGELIMHTSGIDAGLRPVVIKSTMCPLLEQVGFILRRRAHGRTARLPGHSGEPLLQVHCLERRSTLRIGHDARALQCLIVCPGGLLELEGASLPNAALIGIGKPTGIDKHGG